MPHDVFVSYSTKDKQMADAICVRLESANIRCWIAPRDILPGATWGEAIINAINASRILIIVLSSNSNSSQQVLREVERGVSKGLVILPVRVEDIKPSGAMEYFLSSQHWIDVMTPAFENQISTLIQNISTILDAGKGKSAPVKAVKPASPHVPQKFPPPASSSTPTFKIGIAIGGILILLVAALGLLVFQGAGSRQKLPSSTVTPTFSPPTPTPEENPKPTASSSGEISLPLHEAAENGDIEMVETLLKKGMDINGKGESEQTPLHLAVIGNKKAMTTFLISKGANVNARDKEGQTPLHFAAMENQKELAEILLSKGADVNAKDKEDQTPSAATPHEDMIKYLHAHGGK